MQNVVENEYSEKICEKISKAKKNYAYMCIVYIYVWSYYIT